MAEIRTETMTVNMGPQHPATHGVLRLVIELDGEQIVSAEPTIGYLHTGIEKTAEQKKWQQVVPLVERMDYLGPQSNALAYVMSVEKLLGIEVPERVQDIRVLIAELQRISSHLVWLGTHGMEVGAITMMMYCFRERELLLNINEMLAGFRLFPSYIRIGGLREDLPHGFHDAVNAFLDRFPKKMDEYEGMLTKNSIWIGRTKGVGILTKQDCLDAGLLGPIARGSGHRLRRAQGVPVPDLPELRLQGLHAGRRRRLRPLQHPRRRDARELQASASRPSRASRRPACGAWTTRASCPRPRTRSTRRWKRSSSTS